MRLNWLAGLILTLVAASGPARADDYPSRPVKIVIAFSPSGAIDVLGRFIADHLSKMWGQQVIVENCPGGSGNIGAAAAAQAAPDGYTLHFGAQTLATNVTLSPTTAFDPIKSFDPIMLVGTAQEVFTVAVQTPFHSVPEVIDYANANPGKLNYGSVGIGSSAHLATVLFMDAAGIKMQHVPYSQMSQGISDVLTGRTEVWFTTFSGPLPHIKSGKIRAFAVTGPKRAAQLPDLPTFRELGFKMGEESSWYAFFAPQSTPRPIIDKVNRDLRTIIDLPDMREREALLGYRFIGGSPDDLAAFLKAEIKKWDDQAKKGSFGEIGQK